MRVASLQMPPGRKDKEDKALYTLIHLNIKRKTSMAKRETGQNRTGVLHNKQLGQHCKQSFLCRDRIRERDMELFALPTKKGCPAEEKWHRNPQISL